MAKRGWVGGWGVGGLKKSTLGYTQVINIVVTTPNYYVPRLHFQDELFYTTRNPQPATFTKEDYGSF